MRTLSIALLLAGLAVIALAAPAAADDYVVGNCAKTGVCAEVCVSDADTTCWHGGGICVTFSQQVPQCIPRLD